MKGRIIRGIAGFYYVQSGDGTVYECKAKGIFRLDRKKPLPGDYVELDLLYTVSAGEEAYPQGNVREIFERSSELIRPAVANVDQALVIMAAASPQPSLNLLDRFLVTMEQQHIPSVICFNKTDLITPDKAEELRACYRNTGYQVLFTSAARGEGLDELNACLEGRTTTVAGPSGAGKSSLINLLQSHICMETGSISKKIERGKHTTRHSELIGIRPGTYIVDTPGFSSIELKLEKEELAAFFPEFEEPECRCRFTGCAHRREPDCGIKEVLEEGGISRSRYENYCLFYEDLMNRKKY